jgi:hypothetical protein
MAKRREEAEVVELRISDARENSREHRRGAEVRVKVAQVIGA